MECSLSVLREGIWLGMQIKILFGKICCLKRQKIFFLSNPALWSFVGHAVDSRLSPAVGLGHALAFCDGAQSWLFVMAKRQKALHSWDLKQRKGSWTWNTCTPLKAFRIWVWLCSLCWQVGEWGSEKPAYLDRWPFSSPFKLPWRGSTPKWSHLVSSSAGWK